MPLTRAKLDSMPLAQYVAKHWISHAKSGWVVPTVLKLILCLLTSESAPFKNWIRMHDIDDIIYLQFGYENSMDLERDEFCSALYYSSLAGMLEVSDGLLQKGENANAEGGSFGNALQAASYGGNEAIVKLLLEKGAEVNA